MFGGVAGYRPRVRSAYYERVYVHSLRGDRSNIGVQAGWEKGQSAKKHIAGSENPGQAKMAGLGIGRQEILFAGAGADVMDHRNACGARHQSVRHDAHMRPLRPQSPGPKTPVTKSLGQRVSSFCGGWARVRPNRGCHSKGSGRAPDPERRGCVSCFGVERVMSVPALFTPH